MELNGNHRDTTRRPVDQPIQKRVEKEHEMQVSGVEVEVDMDVVVVVVVVVVVFSNRNNRSSLVFFVKEKLNAIMFALRSLSVIIELTLEVAGRKSYEVCFVYEEEEEEEKEKRGGRGGGRRETSYEWTEETRERLPNELWQNVIAISGSVNKTATISFKYNEFQGNLSKLWRNQILWIGTRKGYIQTPRIIPGDIGVHDLDSLGRVIWVIDTIRGWSQIFLINLKFTRKECTMLEGGRAAIWLLVSAQRAARHPKDSRTNPVAPV
ncbi:hypothetical protein V1477_002119 [Vespula maculifrons]|uniref:Uncharacterized protein n=1 Tax=Vespula maculifrons TaxID=7453 RepID=A0ABD2D0X3_VESMC